MKTVKEYEKLIKEKEDELFILNGEKDSLLIEAGENIYRASNEKTFKNEKLNLWQSADVLLSEITDLENSLRKLLAEEEKKEELETERKKLLRESRELKQEMNLLYAEMGREAWSLWNSGRFHNKQTESVLDDLIKAEEKIRMAEEAVYKERNQLIKDSGNLKSRTRSVINKGRTILLSGRKKTVSANMEKLFLKTGKKIFNSTGCAFFDESSESGNIKKVYDKLKEISKRSEKINSALDAQEMEKRKLTAKISVSRHINAVEKELKLKRSALDISYRDLGKYIYGKEKPEVKSDGLNGIFKKIKSLEKKRLEIIGEIESLQKYIDLSEKELSRKSKEAQISKLEEEIKNKQQNLRKLKRELTYLVKEIDLLKEKQDETESV
jgi:hypothetical protein